MRQNTYFGQKMTNKICLYRDVLIEVNFDAVKQAEKVWHVFFQGIFKHISICYMYLLLPHFS